MERSGPEAELIHRFLLSKRIRIPNGCQVSLFEEPRLESGFPDLVIVIWDYRICRSWPSSRLDINGRDLRVLHHLHTVGSSTHPNLAKLFTNRVDQNLGRLEGAGMINLVRGNWKSKPLEKIFAVKEIIAIEAKVKDTRSCLSQAFLNTWFASMSYMLVPEPIKNSSIIQRANELGIGIITPGATLSAGLVARPRSYASWLFNEWAWLHALGSHEHRPRLA